MDELFRIEILARSKDVMHDVTTTAMLRIMPRLHDNTVNLTVVMDRKIKEQKLFIDQVRCNFTYVWGLPSQEGNSLSSINSKHT